MAAEDRYYVKEHAGYPINVGRDSVGGKRAESVEVTILDRAYCHRVAWSSWWKFGSHGVNIPTHLAKARADAAALCSLHHADITKRHVPAAQALLSTLSDGEYAYMICEGGEDYPTRAYGVSYER